MPRSEPEGPPDSGGRGGPWDLPDTGGRPDWQRRHPTLLDGCARAATAAEARYRIDAPDLVPRSSRIVALDDRAAALVRDLAGQHWRGGHFLVFEDTVPVDGSGTQPGDAVLRVAGGTQVLLSSELTGADVAVMVATAQARADAAAVIGDACAARGVASAGLVLPGPAGGADVDGADVDGADVDDVVSALRPNAMVLVILKDPADIPEILTALRV